MKKTCEKKQKELEDELEKKRDSFAVSNGLIGREHLFYYSFLRLYLLENFMRKYNIQNVFHLEGGIINRNSAFS